MKETSNKMKREPREWDHITMTYLHKGLICLFIYIYITYMYIIY